MTVLRTTRALTLVLVAWCGAAVVVNAQPPSPETQLSQARSQYELTKYEESIATLDPLIALLEPQAPKDPAAAKLLAAAYELRARAKVQRDLVEGANADFRALLKIAPTYSLTPPVSKSMGKLFEDIKKATIGRILLNLTAPEGADFELDGMPFTPAAGPIPMAAGTYTLSGRRSGCRPASQKFTVTAGNLTEVVLTLERISATVALVTSPPGVEVFVDSVSRGRTEAGPQPPRWEESLAKAGLEPGATSKQFVLEDLGIGSHTISFALPCHVGVDLAAEITSLTDKVLAPVKLERAVASIWVDSQPPGASVWLDGEQKGKAPFQIDNICEGRRRLEMRSSWGRYVQELTVNAGDKLNVEGTLKPAVALLSVTGFPKGYRGEDPRVDLARRFAAAKSLTFFGPAQEDVQGALNAENQLSPGWLAFDRRGRAVGDIATNITPDARRGIGTRLAQKFEVQGVAEMAAGSAGDLSERVLTILASGSSVPDVVELTTDSPDSVNNAIARLDKVPAMYRPAAGVTVADVLDVTGAVVVNVDPSTAKAGLAPGDIITKADGNPVADGSSFLTAVAQHKQGDTVAVEVLGKAGGSKPATLTITMAPCLINRADQSLLFNNLVVGLRTQIARAGANPDPIVRLNLAAALMRLGNYADARAELSKINLEPGPGVSRGTVLYLLGLCHESLQQMADAEKAWRAAADDPESQLTEDGPFIKELAEEKLAKIKK